MVTGSNTTALIVDGKNISREEADSPAHIQNRSKVTQVLFLLNITQVGSRACDMSINLLHVEIPEGVQEIGEGAFYSCENMLTISFPSTLRIIRESDHWGIGV